MARTTITALTAPTFYSTTGLDITWTAADTTNLNDCTSASDVVLLVKNIHATTTYTVTVTSSADPTTGRTGHITAQNVVALATKFIRLTKQGWEDTNSKFLFEGNNTNIQFAVVKIRT